MVKSVITRNLNDIFKVIFYILSMLRFVKRQTNDKQEEEISS